MTKGNGRLDPVRQSVTNELLASLPNLKAFAVSLTGNQAMAEDMVQETMVSAVANLHRFAPGTNMKSWLITILRNKYFSLYRKRRRESGWDDSYDNVSWLSTESNEAESSYDLNQLLRYIACLPADQSDALIAVGYLGMSYDEVAERLGFAVGTIKSRVNRARISLRSMMEETVLKSVSLSSLKTATSRVPKSHPYYPIAAAYEELYAECSDVIDADATITTNLSTGDKLWEELVASGALDEGEGSLEDLMHDDPQD